MFFRGRGIQTSFSKLFLHNLKGKIGKEKKDLELWALINFSRVQMKLTPFLYEVRKCNQSLEMNQLRERESDRRRSGRRWRDWSAVGGEI